MTVLFIILGVIAAVIALIVVLLHFSVKAYVEADKKSLSLAVKYLWFTVYRLKLPEEKEEVPPADANPTEPEPEPEEPQFELYDVPMTDSTSEEEAKELHEKAAEKAREEEPEETEEEESDEPSDSEDGGDEPSEKEPKPTVLEMWEEYKKYIPAGKKAFRRLLKLIRFYNLDVYLKIGSDDPYKAGLNFGTVNAVFYNALALLCCLFTVKLERSEIECDYENKVMEFNLKTAVYVRPSAVAALAAYLGIYYLKIRKSMKKLSDNAKNKAKENSENE